MRKVFCLIFGLIIAGCASDSEAGMLGKGEVRLALSNVAVTSDWAGNEKASAVWGIDTNYEVKGQVRDMDCIVVSSIDYSEQESNNKTAVTSDNIRTRLDLTKPAYQNVKAIISVKSLYHFNSDDYVNYFKLGAAISDGFELRKATASTAPVRVVYTGKASISSRWANQKEGSLGVLLEADLCALRGGWGVRVKDADIFFTGFNQSKFELPVSVEYQANPLFISYDIIVRGDSKQAGALRTIRAGFRQQF